MFKISTAAKNSNSRGSSSHSGKVPSMGWDVPKPSSAAPCGRKGKAPATNFERERNNNASNSLGKKGGGTKTFGK